MNLLNTQIKDYTLLKELSRGANSVIYYAKNQLGAEVAIKVMEGDADLDVQNLRKHFRQQAQLLVALKHEYITQVYDFFENERCVAIIMEYLDGESLESYMAANPVTEISKVVEWYGQVLPAFERAHQMGVLHRDVNPSTLFVTKSGKLKILSFGTAKIVQDALAESLAGGMKTIIRPDVPYYKSPELITRPKTADQGTDIYSLGVLFYVLTTGIEPYDKQNLLDDVIYKTLPKPHVYSQELFDVVAKAAAKQSKDRFPNCLAFLNALQAVPGVSVRQGDDAGGSKQKDTSTGFKPGKTEIISGAASKQTFSAPGSRTVVIDDHTFGNQTAQEAHQQRTGDFYVPPLTPPPFTPRGHHEGPPPFTSENIGAPSRPPGGAEGRRYEFRVTDEIYSPLQMNLAAFFGGPAVFAYFLSENCKAFGEFQKSSKYMTAGALLSIPYYTLAFLPEDVVKVLQFVVLGGILFMLKLVSDQRPQVLQFVENGGRYRSLGTVILAYVVNVVVVVGLAIKFGY